MSALRRRLSVRWLLPSLALAALAIVDAAVFFNSRASGTVSTTTGSAMPRAASHVRDAAIKPASRTPTAATPLRFSNSHLNLGDGKPKETLRGELTLSNPSSAPVAFSLVKHCGCTELSPMNGVLPPRGNETIKVGVELPDHANSEKNTRIEVRTGDPAVIVADCVLSARCPAPFAVTPSFISFGSLAKEDLADAAVEVRLDSVPGQPALEAAKLSIEHSNEAFRVERLADDLSSGAIAAPPRLALRITLRPDILPGYQDDMLDLRLSGCDYSMRVQLNVTVVDAITVVPGTVFMRRTGDNQVPKPVQLLIIDHRSDHRLTAVSLVNGPPGLQIDDQGDARRNPRRIRLSVPASTDSWPDESEVRLSTDGATFSFKLAISSDKND